MYNFINDAPFKLNNHLKYYIMKKLFLTAAFTLVGVIAVSAQTEQNKPTETTTNKPTTTQTQQPDSKTNPATTDTGTPQKSTTTTTVDNTPATTPATDAPGTVTTMETTKPADVAKEEKKSKKKK